MGWIDGLGTLAGYIVSFCIIGGYIFGIVKYLNSKMKGTPEQISTSHPDEISLSRKPINWVEMMRTFGEGFDGVANSLLNLPVMKLLDENNELSDATVKEPIAGCVAMSYGCVFLLIGFFLAIALIVALFIHNALTAGLAIMCFLFFVTVSLPYIYQVGVRLEQTQSENQQGPINQPEVTQ